MVGYINREPGSRPVVVRALCFVGVAPGGRISGFVTSRCGPWAAWSRAAPDRAGRPHLLWCLVYAPLKQNAEGRLCLLYLRRTVWWWMIRRPLEILWMFEQCSWKVQSSSFLFWVGSRAYRWKLGRFQEKVGILWRAVGWLGVVGGLQVFWLTWCGWHGLQMFWLTWCGLRTGCKHLGWLGVVGELAASILVDLVWLEN